VHPSQVLVERARPDVNLGLVDDAGAACVDFRENAGAGNGLADHRPILQELQRNAPTVAGFTRRLPDVCPQPLL
jgi:hypothetical protein